MSQQEYCLSRRKNTKGKTIYYCLFKDPETGRYGTAKSTGQTSQAAAHQWAMAQIKDGLRSLNKSPLFKNFAKDFFCEDSEYTKDKILFSSKPGRAVGLHHNKNQIAYLENYLMPAFGEMRLDRIGSEEIRQFQLDLRDKGKSAGTITHIVSSLNLILRWACERKLLSAVPIYRKISGQPAVRGVLSLPEVGALFASEWFDQRHKVLNMVAATTGMRQGELLGLQRKAVKGSLIEVYTSWIREQGLAGTRENPGTKTGKGRVVPMPQKVQAEVEALLAVNPWKTDDAFVFYGDHLSTPLHYLSVTRELYRQLEKIGIDPAKREARNLTFHSWRHFFNSLLINSKVPTFQVQALTGHSSDAMSQNYYHGIDDYSRIMEVTQGVMAQTGQVTVQAGRLAEVVAV